LALLKKKCNEYFNKFYCCDLCCIFNKDNISKDNNSISLIEPELEEIRLLEIKENELEIKKEEPEI
jgi:hypothetical protein